MKILNLYAGIGGNRALWGNEHKITAVEINREIAKIYQMNFPSDEVVIADAHQFLIENFNEYDFIWSSPPCPTHSRARWWRYGKEKPVYPDMRLYQEIILLKYHKRTGVWVVENVKPYYNPLIEPTVQIGRHLFWSNFTILKPQFKIKYNKDEISKLENEYRKYGLVVGEINSKMKRTVLRNVVHPLIGKYIFDVVKEVIE